MYWLLLILFQDGNLALLGSRVPDDAFVVKKRRAAGVIILGHANESEDADHRAVISFSEGWSDRGGQTRNVWNGTQQTAGSSTGSAQAVAGYNILLSIGTETHGVNDVEVCRPRLTKTQDLCCIPPATLAWSASSQQLD